MVKLNAVTQGKKKDDVNVLFPLHSLWTDENFQTVWVKAIRMDLEGLKEAIWEMNFDNLRPEDLKTWTQILELPIPKEAEDFKLAVMCLRSIVKYCGWKLSVLERASNRYVQFQQASFPEGDKNR